MIIWLASYPRSGNTLTRQVLHQVFGKASYSRYDDRQDIADRPETAARVGHRLLPAATWTESVARLDADHGLNFVKTHHPPEDAGKTLYVVRHPCAAVISFVHYQRNVRGRQLSPEQILLGLPRGISWGGHLDDWDPLARPDTLLLRFEDLIEDPSGQIERIASFTGLQPIADWTNDFDTLRAGNPDFFRSGRVEPPWDELGAEGRRLLTLLHGNWMVRLGYGEDAGHPDAPMLRRHLATASQYYLDAETELRKALRAERKRAEETTRSEPKAPTPGDRSPPAARATAASAAEPPRPATPRRQGLLGLTRRITRRIRGLPGDASPRTSDAPRPAPGRRLISYSLYGTDPVYRKGAIENAKLAPRVFPGWTPRFYVSDEIPDDLIETLRGLGTEVVRKVRRDVSDGMLWRFLPAADPSLDALIVRDVDTLLCARDKSAVDAWLASGKGFHIIRDHPGHAWLILGGLWGCRGGRVPRMARLIEQWADFGEYGRDLHFLARDIYPLIADDLLVHSDLIAFGDETVEPIPMAREGDTYLGFPADRGELSEKRLASFRRGRDRGLRRLPMPSPVPAGESR